MAVTVRDIAAVMESIAPASIAEKWDNVGLQVGNLDWNVQKVWIALDPLIGVLKQACQHNVNMLVTHHPLLFHPLRSIDLKTPLGVALEMAIKSRLAVFTAHTNLDSAVGGLNDVLAKRIGLTDIEPLVPGDRRSLFEESKGHGLGRIGNFPGSTTLKSLAQFVKQQLNLEFVKIVGDLDLAIYKIAVCTGSGSSLIANFLSTDAQTFISGDLRYHDAQDVLSAGRSLIDIGHFSSEHIIVDNLVERMTAIACERNMNIKIEAFKWEKDPFSRF